jgi:glycosyltransferase involved in cell wall biosynthesis
MTQTVSAVIPTLGRPSLGRAVQSVLGQTQPVYEVIVVADTDEAVTLPPDDRITILRSSFREGPGKCRQLGIDAARGSVIALLDDDDEWYSTKLERQLQAVGGESGTHWIASSRMAVLGPGIRRRIWPRRLIKPEESVTDYLFRFTDLRFGGAALQTSTLCFPTDLARKVRWDAHVGTAHDEPTWLIRVQRAIPDLRVIQLPDVLST